MFHVLRWTRLRFVIVLLVIAKADGLSHDDCWIPCNNFQHGSCVSIQCKTDSRATYECHLISTVMPSYLAKKPLQTCITPQEVPGITNFCSSLLNNDSLLLENLRKDTKPKPVKPTTENEDVAIATGTGSECIPLTILAGVAVGCFTTGCVVTWLFLLVLWSRDTPRCLEATSKALSTTEGDREQTTNHLTRREAVPVRLLSLSHQRLLSSISVESGTSSPQAALAVLPPDTLSVPTQITSSVSESCTTHTTNTEAIHDYTRLDNESAVCNGIPDQFPQNNDYASLVQEAAIHSPSGVNFGNRYLTLQSAYRENSDQSITLPLTRDTGHVIEYPSISRSTRSDIHDYDSIFSDSTTKDVDYADCGNRLGESDDGDCHDYHECEASNSLERHEYFVLQESPNKCFILEKHNK